MIEANETFDGTWPYSPHFFHGNGFAMHYADENPDGQETFLCVHGEPTWGYLYRNIIPVWPGMAASWYPITWGSAKAKRPRTAPTQLKSFATIWTG